MFSLVSRISYLKLPPTDTFPSVRRVDRQANSLYLSVCVGRIYPIAPVRGRTPQHTHQTVADTDAGNCCGDVAMLHPLNSKVYSGNGVVVRAFRSGLLHA